MIICNINHKGGVGKTTTTLNLGRALALQGYKVLLVDCDPQGSLSHCLKLNAENSIGALLKNIISGTKEPIQYEDYIYKVDGNLSLIRSSRDLRDVVTELTTFLLLKRKVMNDVLKQVLDPLRERFDFILLDSPPEHDTLLIDNIIIASDHIVLVVQSQSLATEGLNQMIETINSYEEVLNIRKNVLGILVTQTDHIIVKRNVTEYLRDKYAELVFDTQIHNTVSIMESQAVGQDIFQYENENMKYSKRKNPLVSSHDFEGLAKEILDRLNINKKKKTNRK